MDTICFICDTPFQVMNAVLLWRRFQEERNDVTADIYMGDQFNACRDIAERLKETRMFREVVLYDIPSNVISFLNIGRNWERLCELFCHEAMVRKRTHRNVSANEYSELYLTHNYSKMQFLMRLLNSDGMVNYIEDGVGSYLLDPQCKNRFYLKRLTYQMIRKPFPSLVPAHLYLNSPLLFSIIQEDAKIIPEQLPPLRSEDTETVNLLSWLFDFRRNPLYDERRIVCLTQPYEEATKTKGREKPVLEACEAFRENIVLKLHPRQRDNSPYQGFDIDRKGELWELVSLLQITDNHILLSPFSTAQLLPKIIFDKEPWLVFMAPLWKEMTPMQSKLIDALRQIYRNPEKVIVVRDVPELSMRLEQILRKGEKKYD